jgi:hypothetical protein
MSVTDDINYEPSTAQVGAFLRARLVDAYGKRLPDFGPTTTPTQEEAEEQINEAADEVSAQVGLTVPNDFIPRATRLVQLLAAANIELSFFPEQAAANNSMYDKLLARYTTALVAFSNDLATQDLEQEVSSSSDGASGGIFRGFPFPSLFGTRRW